MYAWLLLIFIVLSCESPPNNNTQEPTASETNEPIDPTRFRDALKLTDLKGDPITPDVYKDKTLILNIWATWCGPCIKEMPDLEEMQAALGDDFILLLASDEGETKIKKFVDKSDFNLQFIQIENSLESLEVYSLPTTFVVGSDGELKDKLVGARNWTQENQLEALKSYSL